MKQKLIKLERELDKSNQITVDNFDTPLSASDRIHKISGYRRHNTIIYHDLINIYKAPHLTTAEYTFFGKFASTRGMFTKINYMLSHETNLNRL